MLAPLGSLCLALLAAAAVIALAHSNPLTAYGALVRGALGSTAGTAETLTQTTILLFTGLGVAVAFRAGLFNIGAEGQLVVGALCAALAGASLRLPALFEIALCFAAGAGGGAVWGFIAGWLRARHGASEVITTIMLNYIAFFAVSYLVSGPLRGSPSAPETAEIWPSAILPALLPGTRLTIALPLALAAAIGVWWWLQRSVGGFELRTLGFSERAARYAGMQAPKIIMQTMALSGALAGLGGASEVLGLLHRFNAALSPGYGFTSIAVALLAQSNPLTVLASAFFFGALQNGALSMQALAGVPKDLVSVIEGLVILFMAVNWFASRFRMGAPEAADKPAAAASSAQRI